MPWREELTPLPVRVHRVDVLAPRKNEDILDKYKIAQPNLLIAASPQNGTRVIFRYKEENGVNPYSSNQAFRSAESLARQAIWEGRVFLFRLERDEEWYFGTREIQG